MVLLPEAFLPLMTEKSLYCMAGRYHLPALFLVIAGSDQRESL